MSEMTLEKAREMLKALEGGPMDSAFAAIPLKMFIAGHEAAEAKELKWREKLLDALEEFAVADQYPQDRGSSFDPVHYFGWLRSKFSSLEARYKAVVEAANDVIVNAGLNGSVQRLNSALSALANNESGTNGEGEK